MKSTWIVQHQHLRQVKMYFPLLLFHRLFPLEYVFTNSISLNRIVFLIISFEAVRYQTPNGIELFKGSSKVHQKNMWGKDLKFWRMKSILQKWFANRGFWSQNTEIICGLICFVEFIQTEKWHPTSLEEISSLTGKLLVISTRNLSYELCSSRTY